MTGDRFGLMIGKFLSYVLRHRPEEIGIELDAHGWTDAAALVAACAAHGRALSRADLDAVVAADDKGRFEFNADGTRIRARQGHSVDVDLDLDPRTPPAVLYQGTASRFIASIRAQGLLKQSRHHVHLSEDRETAATVGTRHGRPVILEVRAGAMAAEGYVFYRTENGAWLTDHVPAHFIDFPVPE